MSRRRQRSASDQVSEFDRGRIVVYRDCGLSFRKIGSRVGRNQTTVIRICDRWIQESTMDRRSRSHPPQCTTSLTHLSATPRWSDSSLETPWREDADQLRYAPPHWSCTSIMVWGGIRYHYCYPLLRITCTLNSQRYISEVLESVVLSYLQGLATAIFQRDNARPHVARIVQRLFVNHQIELLTCPARSPDHSPIENMWSIAA
ncbi:transposable element Tcb1 transposase [Trichonephila clavipes]|nr:transposable element Tcb1 transposase [Trichonephila clavipes]